MIKILVLFFIAATQFCIAAPSLILFPPNMEIYKIVKETCSSIGRTDFYSRRADRLRAGLFDNANFDRLISEIRTNAFWYYFKSLDLSYELDPNVIYLTESFYYQKAITECFRDDKPQQDFKKLILNVPRSSFILAKALHFWGITKVFQIVSIISVKAAYIFDFGFLGYMGLEIARDLTQPAQEYAFCQSNNATKCTLDSKYLTESAVKSSQNIRIAIDRLNSTIDELRKKPIAANNPNAELERKLQIKELNQALDSLKTLN